MTAQEMRSGQRLARWLWVAVALSIIIGAALAAAGHGFAALLTWLGFLLGIPASALYVWFHFSPAAKHAENESRRAHAPWER